MKGGPCLRMRRFASDDRLTFRIAATSSSVSISSAGGAGLPAEEGSLGSAIVLHLAQGHLVQGRPHAEVIANPRGCICPEKTVKFLEILADNQGHFCPLMFLL